MSFKPVCDIQVNKGVALSKLAIIGGLRTRVLSDRLLASVIETLLETCCPIVEMLKGLLTISLLLLLTSQVTVADQSSGDPSSLEVSVSATLDTSLCDEVSSVDCTQHDHCLHANHAGCHMNLIDANPSAGFAVSLGSGFSRPYGVPKLPLNEILPPLRPPQLT